MDDDLIGQVIDGRFEIRAKLGQGGMGAVYRAWQKSVDREVAIKLIHRAFGGDPMAVHRFEREARLASKLSQPNTVSVLDFGTTSDGRLFLAMELIKGRTLHRMVNDGGPFPVERVVRVGTQICDALEAAHGLGIVHRDLKLENVIVLDDPPGRDLVKVLDFGLAKYEGDLRGTAAGVVVGTPRYMAPEVTTSGAAVAASDLYALGVMLCELATAASPWRGDSLGQLLQAKMEPGPATAHVPAPLRGLVAALLEVSPERRPTAGQTRQWLAAIGTGASYAPAGPVEAVTVPGKVVRPPAPVAHPPPPAAVRARARWPWLAAGAGVLAIVGIVVAVSSAQHEPERAVAPAPAPASAPEPVHEAEPTPAIEAKPPEPAVTMPIAGHAAHPVKPAKVAPKKEGARDCKNEPPTSITDGDCLREYCENHPMECASKYGGVNLP